jgi:hypothetical protein
VGASATKDQLAGFRLVDQEPIRFDVAIAPTSVLSAQSVVTVLRVQTVMMTQRLNHGFKLGQVFAALLLSSDIPFELLGGNRFKRLRRRLWFWGPGLRLATLAHP